MYMPTTARQENSALTGFLLVDVSHGVWAMVVFAALAEESDHLLKH